MKLNFSIILVLGIVPLSGTIIIIQSPTNLNLLEGSVAYFPCTSDNKNVPFWRINGQLYDIQFLPNDFSFNATGLVIDHVTLSQNGTTIQCVFSADIATDVVMLTVYSSEESLVSSPTYTSQQETPSIIGVTSTSLVVVTSNYYNKFETSSYETSITNISTVHLSSSTQKSLSNLTQGSAWSSSVTITDGVTPFTDTVSFNNSLITILVPIVITMTVIALCVIGIIISFRVIIQKNSNRVAVKVNDAYEKTQIMTTPRVHIAYHIDDKLHTVSNAAYSTVQYGVD